jgi:hypothetical protein
MNQNGGLLLFCVLSGERYLVASPRKRSKQKQTGQKQKEQDKAEAERKRRQEAERTTNATDI